MQSTGWGWGCSPGPGPEVHGKYNSEGTRSPGAAQEEASQESEMCSYHPWVVATQVNIDVRICCNGSSEVVTLLC